MKLHFEPNLDYQLAAIEAVCDLFQGQEICRSEFTVTRDRKGDQLQGFKNDLGVGNKLELLDDEILENLNAVQLRHGLAPSEALSSGDFTVEMETGTGKTYVYLRTILELNKRYGFSKFVIVVPSVAIKEGVYKTLQITEDHFHALYSGTPVDFFLYDSSKPGPVRNFATSANIQIMVVTVGAINKRDVNNLYKPSEKMGGDLPIDLIRATTPIIIVDEPQSVDGGINGRGKEALDAMHPLCTLRYSATHANDHHMVYRLDAVDAYEQKLVKQIEVAAATVEGAHNKAFVRLISVHSTRGVITAKVELDTQSATGVSRKVVSVQDSDNLEMTTGRPIYEDFAVGEIRTAKDDQFMELRYPGGETWLRVGEAYGDIEPLAIQRQMIKRTIKEHLDKELRLSPQGIKVLSLFFIDSVEKYRSYDEDGQAIKGDYATIFEEEYRRLAKHPDYQTLFEEVDLATAAEDVHNGYFSIDKRVVTPFDERQLAKSASKELVETSSYNLIMKDKERLLNKSEPLKFIFSHSALREGWDNPNVFQICSLREMNTEQQRRQTIGRGLRLCVNQEGERLRGFGVNTLTVIASESYEEFAEKLQKETEDQTGIRFGIVESHQFAGIFVADENGEQKPMGFDQSKELWAHLKEAGFIDHKNKVQDSLRTALKEKTLTLPEPFTDQLSQVSEILKKLSGGLEIKNADDRKQVKTRRAILESEEFKALWDRIKHKTTYRVQFNNEKLLEGCIEALKQAPPIAKTRLQWRKAGIQIGRSGVSAEETGNSAPVTLDEGDIAIPDILTELQDRTHLTRRGLCRVLLESDRLDDFKRNPQQFIDLTAEVVNRSKRLALVDGIKYQRVGDDDYYAQQLFETEELTGYLKSMIDVNKSVHEQVIYDSGTEHDFAVQLERNESIKLYAKLPSWFKIPTPLGTYNPDWAVLVDTDGTEQLYFVVETKSSLFTDDLRDKESAKIKCGKAHFSELAQHSSPSARFIKATSIDDVFS